MRRGSCAYFGGARSWSATGLAVEATNLESTTEQTFDTALDTQSENKSVNDVNESMQTSTNVTENNSDDPALLKNINDDFRLYILENGLNQKANIIFTISKRTYDDGINRYLKKRAFLQSFNKSRNYQT